jgi:hypothetical protein
MWGGSVLNATIQGPKFFLCFVSVLIDIFINFSMEMDKEVEDRVKKFKE